MREATFETYGTAALMIASIAVVWMIRSVVGTPEFTQSLTQFSPWAGQHANVLAWTSMGVVFFAGMAVPLILTLKDTNDGGGRLHSVGIVAVLLAATPCVGFLLWIGWHAALRVLAP